MLRAATVAVVIARAATVAVARAATVAVFDCILPPFALSARAASVSKGHPCRSRVVAVAFDAAFDVDPR